jgi:ABC-type uncharacterized transport system substrate-binding protein
LQIQALCSDFGVQLASEFNDSQRNSLRNGTGNFWRPNKEFFGANRDSNRRVVSIAANSQATVAAKAATSTIPIVFITGADPVQVGFISSLNRPGGDLTGVTSLDTELGRKRLQLLHELLPNAGTIAALVNPTFPGSDV